MLAKSRSLFYLKIRGVCFMTRIGFKTFVYSFVFTLSAVISVDRAFFYTPRTAENSVQIPRKNIALFFRPTQPYTYSSQTEPVQQDTLKEPEKTIEEVKIVENLPLSPPLPKEEEEEFAMNEKDIPLFVEKIPEADKEAELNSIPDMPLVYSGDFGFSGDKIEKKEKIAQLSKSQNADIEEAEVSEEVRKPIVLSEYSGPITIKGTRQVYKIDNLKKYKERKALENKEQEDDSIQTVTVDTKNIPLQGNTKKAESIDFPEKTQIASLGESQSLADAEKDVGMDVPAEGRKWQTMAEKHKNDNPWLVARGSKFVKNKKLLKEGFASETAKKKAESIVAENNLNKNKNLKQTKVAVQDNLLIPIPQEILDEDDLVPDISNDDGQSSIPPRKKSKVIKETKQNSILESISSVFSKENREKAIKKLKAKSNNLLKKPKKDEEEERPIILPTEIRLSFQPNRAEISGQTLRWVQAFAKKAVDEKDVGLEIRIDGSKSFALQQKRLNMLYNILTANGVDYQKINTVFSDREPNSFVMRTVKIVNAEQSQKEDDGWKKYYQKW